MFYKRLNGRNARKELTTEQRNEYSLKICQKIQHFITDKQAIMVYNAIDGEVDVKHLLSLKNKVFIYPRIEDNNIVPVVSSEFSKGMYGIMEPVGAKFNQEIEAIIVPMCAYDTKLNRLGFGKGYYDRFLQNKKCLKIGVAFSCQQTDNIVEKNSDVKMDLIINENNILGEL